jgi:hypothetical protein
MVKDKEIVFVPSKNYLPDVSSQLSVPQLFAFDPDEFENALYLQDTKRELLYRSSGISLPNMVLKDYLVFFVASTLARYRPVQWHSILAGETLEGSEFALRSNEALRYYTIESMGAVPKPGFLFQVHGIFNDIKERRFKFIDRDGNPLETS